MAKKVNNQPPVFIISGKSPIGASGGGYSTYAYNLARILKKLHYPVYIIALGKENKTEKTEVGTLITFRATIPFLNVNIYALPGLPYYSVLFSNGIKKIIDQNSHEKFIIWGIGPWGFAASVLKLFFRKKVFHINNYFTTSKHEWSGGVKALEIKDYGILPKLKYTVIYLTAVQFISLLERIVLKTADVVITNYKSTENILKKEFHLKPQRFYRAHFYVQVYKRKVKEASTGQNLKLPNKYILFFSRQDPRKGVNYLIHAMRILVDKGYKVPLLIAGGGDMLDKNKKLSYKLKLTKYVKFLGFVNDPKPVMKKCSVFAFPSIEEGAGALTINEAMEMGLPIVSTACDGIVEDLENYKSGILVPMQNPAALANGIAYMLDNPKKAKEFGKNARKSYEKNLSFSNMFDDIKKLTERIVNPFQESK